MNNKWRVGNRDEIYSPAIDSRGYLSNKFGINNNKESITKFPSNSFPLWWKKINGAKSYALLMEGYDNNEMSGVPCIHWVALNIKENELYDNQSLLDYVKWKNSKSKVFSENILWQGYNSTSGYHLDKNNKKEKFKNSLTDCLLSEKSEDACIYLGPILPFKETHYILKIFGLEVDASELEYIESFDPLIKQKLNTPFYASDLLQAIMNHIVGSWTLCFKYKNSSDVVLENNEYYKNLKLNFNK